jgi:hypothetical protein
VIPELRFRANLGFSENAESEDIGVGVLIRGCSPSKYNVLTDLRRFRCTFICREGSVGSWADFLAILTIVNLVDANIIIKYLIYLFQKGF